MRKPLVPLAAAVAAALSLGLGALPAAAEGETIIVTLKDKTFVPPEVKIAVGKTVRVTFKNGNTAAAEIESKPLNIEQDLQAGGEITVNVTAKEKGRFLFVDEFQEDVAKGFFVAE